MRTGSAAGSGHQLERLSAVTEDEADPDSRRKQVAELTTELIEAGCAAPVLDCEVPDPVTGEVLAIVEASWPEGLQPGQGGPVVLQLDPEDGGLARLEKFGYEVFTSADSLRGYVRRRNREAAGAGDLMTG